MPDNNTSRLSPNAYKAAAPITVPVTIGMPVYNGAVSIRRALDSLLAQSFTNFVLIISDNASTDRTEEICNEYAKKDHRLVYIRQPTNIGAAANYSFLIQNAHSKYFFFAPHDDEWGPNWISAAVCALDGCPSSSIALGKIEFVDNSKKLIAVATPPWNLDQDHPLERITKYLNTEVTDHIMYGVMRLVAIKDFRFGLGETSPERALIFNLLTKGKVVDAPRMMMTNHMSGKKQDELYAFFQFRNWHCAWLKSHFSCLKIFFINLPVPSALAAVGFYLLDIVSRKILREQRSAGNVLYSK